VIYTQFSHPRGGIESDLTVTRWARTASGDAGSNFAASDLGWILIHRPDAGVRCATFTAASPFGIWGPRRPGLQAVTASDVSNAALPYMSAAPIESPAARSEPQRVTTSGAGLELYVATEHAVRVWDALLPPAGRRIEPRVQAVDSLRLDKGYRYWSTDLTPAENPYEAASASACATERPSSVARRWRASRPTASSEGFARSPCGHRCRGRRPVGGEAVYVDGRAVGLPERGLGLYGAKHIGLVYLPPALSATATPLEWRCSRALRCRGGADALYDPAAPSSAYSPL